MSTTQKSDYNNLLLKLDDFIRKYYKNQMIRGVIYFVALALGSYLMVTLLEYFGRFNIPMRTFLFWTFVLSTLFLLVRFIAIPLAKMLRLGRTISHEQAAIIIGKHFPDVEDKLLNTLQLHQISEQDHHNSLLQASINQRIASLRPVPFSSAIDLRENKKYLPYAIPPLAIFLILLFAAPSILTKPTNRLIRFGEFIPDEAPFRVDVTNELKTPENTDFTVFAAVSGSPVPEKLYVEINGQKFMMEKDSKLNFSYTFKNVQENTLFRFFGDGYFSDGHEIEVLPTPRLIDFTVDIEYPSYLNRQNETIRNSGDLVVPAGSKLQWNFRAKNTNELSLLLNDSVYAIAGDNEFRFNWRAMNDATYKVAVANSFMAGRDSMNYRLQVIPDLHPSINVNMTRDSALISQFYFSGEVNDDYGFKRLSFNYSLVNAEDPTSSNLKSIDIPVAKDAPMDEFFYDWNIAQINVEPGQKVVYYFEVWDNDGVNGSKSTKSAMFEYTAPTEEELEQLMEQKNEDIKDKLEESAKDAKKLQKELEDLQRQMLEKKEINWQDKKKLEELLKKQEELKNQVEEIQQQNEQKNRQEKELNQQEEKLLEKQKQLDELMNQVMSPELEKMMEELQRLMEQLNKDEIQKQLDKMDLSNKDLEKELDRALEQFKQLEFEQKMEKTIDKLEKLAEKQEELSKESEKKETSSEELQKQQEELNKEFEKAQEDLKELEKLNEELENPNKVPDTKEEQKQISQEQKESSESLQKNKKSNASKSQKKAADDMKKMAEQLDMAMQSNEQEQQQEDMDALRALLENIITLSFDQENLMTKFKSVDIKDPVYNKLGQEQRKLKDDARMVEDSLFALSKRVAQLSSIVNHEINLVNENMQLALENIPDRKTPEITTAQQYVMTSFNNLALLLDEALKQMQNQASCSKPGQGNCEKPGGSGSKPKPSAGQMKKMQESLSKQLEEMKKNGQNKGDSKAGQGEMSKQLAEMAARQAAIRKMMEEKANELNQDGSGNGNELKQISREMEELQKDIVNNRINDNTLQKQRDIMIRLLKAEEAERTRDKDNERKSNESKNAPISNPEKYEEYLRKKQQETELLKTVPPALKPYYREKVNSYFNKIGNP